MCDFSFIVIVCHKLSTRKLKKKELEKNVRHTRKIKIQLEQFTDGLSFVNCWPHIQQTHTVSLVFTGVKAIIISMTIIVQKLNLKALFVWQKI
jgi:hypothetical protein